MKTMQAWVIDGHGEPEVFRSATVPVPALRPGHVLIEVAATSVNPVDAKIRRFGPGIAPALPAILHGDVAGTIVGLGDGVGDFRIGDQVYGCVGGVRGSGGALADFVLADARLIARRPASLTLAQSAALPLVSITAWEGICERGDVQAGQQVLVHAGTGGVGHMALQFARQRGARVYTTVSSAEKAAIATALGADVAINYREQSVADYIQVHTGDKGFDVVYDTLGGANFLPSVTATRLNGTLLSCQMSDTHDTSPLHARGLTLHVVFMLIPLLHDVGRERHGHILREVAALVDAGKVRPHIDRESFSFAQIADAHRHLESGKAVGKIVVTR